MGFLDHSTNNIIVDAVLTEKGRQLLAQNKLNIVGYTFGDDEVDYSLILKYGEIVGKEKIQKNTPIFEASTSSVSPIKSILYTDLNLSDGIDTLSASTFDSNSSSFTLKRTRVSSNGDSSSAALGEIQLFWDKQYITSVNSESGTPSNNSLKPHEVSYTSNYAGTGEVTFTLVLNNGVSWTSTVVRAVDTLTGQSTFISVQNTIA